MSGLMKEIMDFLYAISARRTHGNTQGNVSKINLGGQLGHSS